MTITVRGKQIIIDDSISEKFKNAFGYPIDENDILIYTSVGAHTVDPKSYIDNHNEKDISTVVTNGIEAEFAEMDRYE